MAIADSRAAALALDPGIDVRRLETDSRFGVFVTWMKSPLIAVLNTEEEGWARAHQIAKSRHSGFLSPQSKHIPMSGKIELKREFNAFGSPKLD